MADVKLKPGRVSDFAASMAEAMDKAFQEEWRMVKRTTLSSLGQEERRILLVAIAQGIVAHLQLRAEAIQVEVQVDSTSHHGGGTAVDVKADGLMSISSL